MSRPGGGGRVVLDLRAAQSPHYRERGIARYAADLAASLAAGQPGRLGAVLVDGALAAPPMPPEVARLATSEPGWPEGGVFHLQSPFELDVPVRRLWPRAVERARMRTVVTLYDLIPDVMDGLYLARPGVRRRYRARREVVRAADHVVTLSESAASDAVERWGLDPHRVTVIGAAPSPTFAAASDREQARRSARDAVAGLGERWVVCTGGVEPRKNLERLVDAYAALPAAVRSRWQLVLVCRLEPLERNHFEVVGRRLGIEGQLVLTGRVGDDLLRSILQGADLAVVPSLYEGYGLPVAEARACATPAIASATSSLVELVPPEATFDPHDTGALTAALRSALTEPRQRALLEAWAATPPPGWETVTDRLAEVYDRLLAGPLPPTRPAPRLAVVTPLAPATTGVADYSERLVGALRRQIEVDTFVDDPSPLGPDSAQVTATGSVGRARSLPAVDALTGGYDAVLLCLGNSPYHLGALRLLRSDIAATVLAHDAVLTNLYRHGVASGAVPEGWERSVLDMYPERFGPDGPVPETLPADLLMAREVAARSRRMLCTSETAAALVRADLVGAWGPAGVANPGVWPFAYPPAAARDLSLVDADLVCSFGVLNRVKLPEVVVAAVARVRASSGRDLRLAFVGPASEEDASAVRAAAAAAGIARAVEVTGKLPRHEYDCWLGRAAVAVQLRSETHGETSAAVADCLSRGIPTVVSDLGTFTELGDAVATVPAEATVAEVAAGLGHLLADSAARERLAGAALELAAARGFDTAARLVCELLPELSRGRPRPSGPTLPAG